MPIYGTKYDKQAIELYKEAGLTVFPFMANTLLYGEGSLHCFSMNFPSTSTLNSNITEINNYSDDEWTDWRNTSQCSKVCGGGFQKQLRFCNELSCDKIFEKQRVSCNEEACPDIDGGWGEWKQNRSCTDRWKSNLTEIWSRKCDSPRVSGNGLDCQGKAEVKYRCPGPVYNPYEKIKAVHQLKSSKKIKGNRNQLSISLKANHDQLVPIKCTVKFKTKKNKKSYLEVCTLSLLINPKSAYEAEIQIEGLKKKGKFAYSFEIDSCEYQKRTKHYF